MFSFSKKTNLAAGPAAGDIPVRTMQDDLNALEGTTSPTPTPAESVRPSVQGPFPETKPAEPKTAASRQAPLPGSPFSAHEDKPVRQAAVSDPAIGTPADPASQKPKPDHSAVSQKEGQEIPEQNLLSVVSGKTIGIFGTSILTLILFVGGAYYFWTTRNASTQYADSGAAAVDSPDSDVSPEEEASADDRQEEKNTETSSVPFFSADKPNYLPVPKESFTPSGIQKLLKDTSAQLTSSGIRTPIEFIVTDQENGPILLADFAKASDLSFPDQLLDSLNGKFSLYLYIDQGSARTGLLAEAKDGIVLKNILLKEEPSLATKVKPLFLGDELQRASGAFGDSTYRGIPVRFLNVNEPKTLSVDYAVVNNKLVLATSKNTGRAILDYVVR
jgi:hypothetical protein